MSSEHCSYMNGILYHVLYYDMFNIIIGIAYYSNILYINILQYQYIDTLLYYYSIL